jgi:hypothetical protein
MENKSLDIDNHDNQEHLKNHYNCAMIKAMLSDPDCKEPYFFISYQDVFEDYIKPRNLKASLQWIKRLDDISKEEAVMQEKKLNYVKQGLEYFISDLIDEFERVSLKAMDAFPIYAWDEIDEIYGDLYKCYRFLYRILKTDTVCKMECIGFESDNMNTHRKITNRRSFYVSRRVMESIFSIHESIFICSGPLVLFINKLYKALYNLEKGIEKNLIMNTSGRTVVKKWEEWDSKRIDKNAEVKTEQTSRAFGWRECSFNYID